MSYSHPRGYKNGVVLQLLEDIETSSVNTEVEEMAN